MMLLNIYKILESKFKNVPPPLYIGTLCAEPTRHLPPHSPNFSSTPSSYTILSHKILDFGDLYNFIKFSEPSKNRGSTGISEWLMLECPPNIHGSQQCPLGRIYMARNKKSLFFLFMAFYIRNLQVFPILQRGIWRASRESWLICHHIALFINFCKVLWVFSNY